MLYLMEKELLPERSPVRLKLALDREEELRHFEIASGAWKIEDSALSGSYRENGGGMIYTRESFPGDVLMDFYGMLAPPCENDLNFTFKTEGYDYEKNDAGRGYIAGFNGWWDKKAGIEKYPACRPSAQTALFSVESGIWYHIQTGCVQGHCFIFVDGTLVLEMLDDSPEDFAAFGRVGFGAYCSQVRYRELTVYSIRWKARAQRYVCAF